MSLQDKIEAAKERLKQKGVECKLTTKWKIRASWKEFKDFLLVLYLLNTLIGLVAKVDIMELTHANLALAGKEVVIYNKAGGVEVAQAASAATQPEEKEKTPIEDIVSKIHKLESSGGKNDGCKNKGLYNGYGYAQNEFTWNCYKTQDEAKSYVVAWFEKNLKDKTIAEAVCYYNTGIVSDDCEYYNKFQSI